MARMTSSQMMGPFRGHVSVLNGVPAHLAPTEVAQRPFNVRGNAGILSAGVTPGYDEDGMPTAGRVGRIRHDVSLNPSPRMSP
jgi:hypothetical protein